MYIQRRRAGRISRIAHQYWSSFLKADVANGGASAIFSHLWPNQHPSPEGGKVPLQFFEHCAERIYHAELKQKVYDTQKIRPQVKIALAQHSYFKNATGIDDRVSAWTYVQNGEESCAVVRVLRYQDFEKAREKFRRVNPYLSWMMVVLHETGHLVLHHSMIIPFDLAPEPTATPIATEDEEAEAWFFASTVVGFALSMIAYQQRYRRNVGAPWEHLTWRYGIET